MGEERKKNPLLKDAPGTTEITSTELHALLAYVNQKHISKSTQLIAKYSTEVLQGCEIPLLGDFNRVRYMVLILQPKTDCAVFREPCRDCGRAEENHPWKRNLHTRCSKKHLLRPVPPKPPDAPQCLCCKLQGADASVYCEECAWYVCDTCYRNDRGCIAYVRSNLKVCVCGFPGSPDLPHNVRSQPTAFECKCDSIQESLQCGISTIKTYLAYGLKDILMHMAKKVAPGGWGAEQGLQRWILLLLRLLALAGAHPDFATCWGMRAFETFIKPVDSSFLVGVVDRCLGLRSEVRKTQEQVLAFCSALDVILKGEIVFPHFGVNEQTHSDPDQEEILDFSKYWMVLMSYNNYRKIFQVEAARHAFIKFFEVASHSPTLETVTQCLKIFIDAQKTTRSVSVPLMQAIVELMVAESHVQAGSAVLDIIVDFPEPHVTFAIPHLRERGIVSYLFAAITLAADELACEVLHNLEVYLFKEISGQPQTAAFDAIATEWLLKQIETCRELRSDKMPLPTLYAQHMCQRLYSDAMREARVAVEGQTWLSVVEYVNDVGKPIDLRLNEGTPLHQWIQLAHHHDGNSVTRTLLDFSSRVKSDFVSHSSPFVADFEEWNRLRFIVYTLHPLTYPSEQGSCFCNTTGNCLLFAAKSLINQGAFTILQSLSRRLLRSNIQVPLQVWLLHTLWVFVTAVCHPAFRTCHGRTFSRIFIQSCAPAPEAPKMPRSTSIFAAKPKSPTGSRGTMTSVSDSFVKTATLTPSQLGHVKPSDLLFLIAVEGRGTTRVLHKTYLEVRGFCESLIEVMRAIHWPLLPAARNVLPSEGPEFDAFILPFQQIVALVSHKSVMTQIFEVAGSRAQFLEFFDIDTDIVTVTRGYFMQCTTEALESHRAGSRLPRVFLEMLSCFLAGQVVRPPPTLEMQARVDVINPRLDVPTLQEVWVLQLVLLGASLSQSDGAVDLLRNLVIGVTSQPRLCLGIAALPNFHNWFLPLIYHQGLTEGDVKEQGGGSGLISETLHHTLHLLGYIHSDFLIYYDGRLPEDALLPTPGLLLIRCLIAICMGSSTRKIPWHTIVLRARDVAGCVLRRATTSFGSWRPPPDHAVWDSLFEVLNVFRNMACCSVSSDLTDQGRAAVVQELSSLGPRPAAASDQVLASEHLMALIVELLQDLRLHDPVYWTEELRTDGRIQHLQGSAVAFLLYFRECLKIFRGVRQKAVAEGHSIIKHFFASYPFSITYSKEAVDRLKAQDAAEARIMKSQMAMAYQPNTETQLASQRLNQITRDFEHLTTGVSVYLMASPKPEMCRLSLTKDPKKKKGKESYLVGWDLKKKRTLTLFDEVKLLLGAKEGPMGELEHCRERCIVLTWKKKRLDFACATQEDFDCWARVLTYQARAIDFKESLGPVVDEAMIASKPPHNFHR